jgi:glycosyltransferase involved in cell wall biosynthesis
MQVALVLWDGNVGGAERVTAEIAGGLRAAGVDARLVFVRDPKTLAADLDRLDVPYVSFGARRVEEVLWRPRRFARLVRAHGRDGALLPALGHLAPALRLGGYRAPLVAVEHGFVLLMRDMSRRSSVAREWERRLSAPFVDAEVAVSRFMRDQVLLGAHASPVAVIENGIELAGYEAEAAGPLGRDGCVFASASTIRLGKGVAELVEAFAAVAARRGDVTLRIAGDGPERDRIAALVDELGLGSRVVLAGVVADMRSFWRDADVAVMPSTSPESFGMVALEAMAAARPVVATRNGGAEEVVDDAVSGALVPCGDVGALADAMLAYAADRSLRREHGAAGRARCESRFAMSACAGAYARLLGEIGATRRSTTRCRPFPRRAGDAARRSA